MGQPREALIARLMKESGLNDSETRRFLNALAECMNEDLERLDQFTLPGVGILTRAADVSDPASAIKVEWSQLEQDLTGIKPVPTLEPEVVIPGIVGIVGGEPITGIKPPLAEPAPDVLPPTVVVAGVGDFGLPLDEIMTDVSLSDEGGEPAAAGEGQGPDDVISREP